MRSIRTSTVHRMTPPWEIGNRSHARHGPTDVALGHLLAQYFDSRLSHLPHEKMGEPRRFTQQNPRVNALILNIDRPQYDVGPARRIVKNHLGDRNEHLPINHGFDEFFGNLYHLNAEEEPEMADYFPEKDFADFRATVTPRGVLHSWATDQDDPNDEPRWGRIGRQKIEDTG